VASTEEVLGAGDGLGAAVAGRGALSNNAMVAATVAAQTSR
jgi:hypothetical protein